MRIATLLLTLTLITAGCVSESGARLSGLDLYVNYCAACHGANGEGDGPVGNVMQVQVPNLRLLSERNNGIFPKESITEYIDGRTVVSSHGDRSMPVWGDVFRWADEDDPEAEQLVQQRIAAVVGFIDEMQY